MTLDTMGGGSGNPGLGQEDLAESNSFRRRDFIPIGHEPRLTKQPSPERGIHCVHLVVSPLDTNTSNTFTLSS